MQKHSQTQALLHLIRKNRMGFEVRANKVYLLLFGVWLLLSIINYVIAPAYPELLGPSKDFVVYVHFALELIVVFVLPMLIRFSSNEAEEMEPGIEVVWQPMDIVIAVALVLVTVTLLLRGILWAL